MKSLIFKIVAIALVLFTGLNILAYNHARAMLTHVPDGLLTTSPEKLSFLEKAKVLITGIQVPRPQSSKKPNDLAEHAQAITIPSSNGIQLGAWYAKREKDSPLLILFHGYTAEKASLLPEAKLLLEMGCSVLLVDFRGSGDSSESYTTIGALESEDVTSVMTYAQANLDHDSIILFGHSMGAVAILRAIHHDRITPDAIILSAVYDSMLNTVRNRFKSMRIPPFPSAELLIFWAGQQGGFNGFTNNPMDYAKAISCPVLFLHGEKDPRTLVEDGQRVFEAAPEPKTFKLFPKVGHVSFARTHPDEWTATLKEFLQTTE